MPVDITLDRQELDLTYYVGQYRRQLSMARGYHRPINMVNLEDDQMAAAAEYAVAKYLGVFWNALSDNFANLPDLGNGDEVKHARNRAHNLLIPGDTKRRDCWYYLVLGEPPELTIFGRAWGEEAMTDENWFTGMPRPGWRVLKETQIHAVPGDWDWGESARWTKEEMFQMERKKKLVDMGRA